MWDGKEWQKECSKGVRGGGFEKEEREREGNRVGTKRKKKLDCPSLVIVWYNL